MPSNTLIGVDVSKHWLDACLSGQAGVERIANTPQAIAAWIKRAKPNRIDARLIADFAADRLARGALLPSPAQDETLRALAARRRQLCDAVHAERCRLDLAEDRSVRRSLAAVIKVLAKSLDAIEAAIAQHIKASPETQALSASLQAIRGIGPVTATTLIADLPELGHLTGKQVAALVGLAPQTRESGKTRYRAQTGHGRALVRSVLFNAARAAIRHPSPMKDFYDRLVQHNQRPGKVALCAVMRKLVVIANAVARDARHQSRTPTA